MSAAQSIEEETSVFKRKKSKHFIVYMKNITVQKFYNFCLLPSININLRFKVLQKSVHIHQSYV